MLGLISLGQHRVAAHHLATLPRHPARCTPRAVRNRMIGPGSTVAGADTHASPLCNEYINATIRQLAGAIHADAAQHPPVCIGTGRTGTLAKEDLRSLRRICRPARNHPPGSSMTCIAAMRMQALDDYCRAGLKQMELARRSHKLEHNLSSLTSPGAERTVEGSASLDAGIGIPGTRMRVGVDARIAGAGKRACFETLEYAEGHSVTASASLAAVADLVPSVLDCEGSASASIQHASFRGAVSAQAFAQHVARAASQGPRVSRMIRAPWRLFGSWSSTDAYAEALRAAARWDPLLPTLTGNRTIVQSAGTDAGGGSTRWGTPPPPLIDVRARSKILKFDLRASASACHGSANIARTRMDVELDVPVWLPDAPLEPAERSSLVELLGRRVLAWAEPTHSETTVLATAMLRNLHEPGYAQHELLLQRLQVEWQLLQELLLRRRWCPDPVQLRGVKRGLWAQWDCRDSRTLVKRMLDVCHWIQLSATDHRHVDAATACTLERQARDLANDILSSPALDRNRRWLRDLHATRPMRQRVRQTTLLSVAATPLPGTVAAVGVSVTRSVQHNYNPLRDGRCIDVSIAMQGVADVASVQRLLALVMPEADLAGSLDVLLPGQQGALACLGNTSATLIFRFFRPSFQDDDDYPTPYRGYHLQQLRVLASTSLNVGGRLPVSVLPALETGAGLNVASSRVAPLQPDTFFSHTATAPLLRYQSLLGQGMGREQAWQHLLDGHRSSLLRLDHALRRPGSPAAAEIMYWLKRRQLDDRAPLAPWSRFLDARPPCAAEMDDLAALWTLFDQVLPPLCTAQRRSPMCLPLRLPRL